MTHILKSKSLKVAIDLPIENYKGSRFDWSGKISSVRFENLPLTTIEDTESKNIDFLDTTSRSIEELATVIMKRAKLKRQAF